MTIATLTLRSPLRSVIPAAVSVPPARVARPRRAPAAKATVPAQSFLLRAFATWATAGRDTF